MNADNLGEKIKTLRKLRNVTQSQLTGGFMTRNMLSRIENGSASPSLESLRYIAKQLDISPGWLLDDTAGLVQYEKSSRIGRIKKLFTEEDYSACEQECGKLLSDGGDDELYLIAAESAYNNALEYFREGKLTSAETWFEKAVGYNKAGLIEINTLNDAAEAYINYIKIIYGSSRLRDDFSGCVLPRPFPPYEGAACVNFYILAKAGKAGIVRSAVETGEVKGIFADQISAALSFAESDFNGAEDKYRELLKSGNLPIEINYIACSELEKIARIKDNYKLAYACAERKLELINRAGK